MAASSPDGDTSVRPAQRPDAMMGLRLIVGYKFAKAAAELLVGALFLFLGSVGLAEGLTVLAQEIRHHATETLSIALADRLIHASTAHNVFVVAVAVTIDGTVTLLEGWTLHRRYRWSPWLVVCTTASLIPFEVLTLARHPSTGRILLLLVNALILAYLVQRRHTFERRST